jgi:hypothetical protein
LDVIAECLYLIKLVAICGVGLGDWPYVSKRAAVFDLWRWMNL